MMTAEVKFSPRYAKVFIRTKRLYMLDEDLEIIGRLSRPVGIPERALLYRGIGAVRVRATHADRDNGEEQR